jgi:hypothetical protein
VTKGFREDPGGGKFLQGFREGHPIVVPKISIEALQMIGFQGQVELREHNVPKLSDTVGQTKVGQIQVGYAFQPGRSFAEYVKIDADLVPYSGMLYFDGNVGTNGIGTGGLRQLSLVDLCDASGADGFRFELQKIGANAQILQQRVHRGLPGVSGGLIAEFSKILTKLGREQILSGGGPLHQLDVGRSGLFNTP